MHIVSHSAGPAFACHVSNEMPGGARGGETWCFDGAPNVWAALCSPHRCSHAIANRHQQLSKCQAAKEPMPSDTQPVEKSPSRAAVLQSNVPGCIADCLRAYAAQRTRHERHLCHHCASHRRGRAPCPEGTCSRASLLRLTGQRARGASAERRGDSSSGKAPGRMGARRR